MDITFVNPGVDYMIRSIMLFQTEGEAEFWHEPLYHFYPQLGTTHVPAIYYGGLPRVSLLPSVRRSVCWHHPNGSAREKDVL